MTPAIGAAVDVKKTFFDRIAVVNAVDKANRKALGKIGGYVRKVARNSIRSGKGISDPGSPPRSHTGRLKDGILYGYDQENNSVVVGPTVWRISEPLELLEYGGTAMRKGKPARYHARPFMGPAMEKSAPFDRFWENSVK